MIRYQVVCFTIVSVCLGTLAVSCVACWLSRKKRKQISPQNPKWKFVGTVAELSIYPLRSGAALLLQNAECTKLGLQTGMIKDRSFFLFNDEGKSIFAGAYPAMLSITSKVENESIVVLSAPNMDPIRLNVHLLSQGKVSKVKQCKGFQLHLTECDQHHHEWFSQVILGQTKGLRLFISQRFQFESSFWGTDKSEYNPLMIMNDKSVKDLNNRLSEPTEVHHLQFRGNILLKCAEDVTAYDEDRWKWLKLGDSSKEPCIVEYTRPCLRCILPNIDIWTCERNMNFEPLRTLKSYRLVHDPKEPTMGAYFKVHTEGTLRVNDPVYALFD